jgi:phage shock protein PspC (stress-responsive transcriptional regulator)
MYLRLWDVAAQDVEGDQVLVRIGHSRVAQPKGLLENGDRLGVRRGMGERQQWPQPVVRVARVLIMKP